MWAPSVGASASNPVRSVFSARDLELRCGNNNEDVEDVGCGVYVWIRSEGRDVAQAVRNGTQPRSF